MAELVETFEGAPVISYTGDWTVTTGGAHAGDRKLDSGVRTSGFSQCNISIPAGATSVRLWVYLTLLTQFSYFEVSLNGGGEWIEYDSTSGNGVWQQTPALNVTGKTTLTLQLQTSNSPAGDSVYVDDIVFDGGQEPEPPVPTTELVEDFEDTTYVIGFTGAWARPTSGGGAGPWAPPPHTAGHSITRSVTVTVPPGATQIKFKYRVSSEPSWDVFEFLVGGAVLLTNSGETGWLQSALYSVAGQASVVFRFRRDGSDDGGSNCAWVDDVTFLVPVVRPPAVGWGIPIN
jgi:hypothetical protein